MIVYRPIVKKLEVKDAEANEPERETIDSDEKEAVTVHTEFDEYEAVVDHKDWLDQDEEIVAIDFSLQLEVTW